MAPIYKYFLIPFDKVPAHPTYTVWFATWSKDRPTTQPSAELGFPMVVGLATEDQLPAGAVVLAGSKDPLPPPPPPPPLARSQSEADYQKSCRVWLERRDEDEDA